MRQYLTYKTCLVAATIAMLSGQLFAQPNQTGNKLSPKEADENWKLLFDGKSLTGWHVSAKTGHSGASKHQSGGRWVIENGAVIGSQDIPGNGGIIITDEQFEDFEVALEMNNDFGPDSGLFLRSTEDGKAWQAMIDYHAGAGLMGVYGEGIGGKPVVMNFKFKNSPYEIEELVPAGGPPLPVLPEAWSKFWRHGEWNELRARIVGNPPHITTWINGVKFCDWRETERRHPDQGGIALQVHGGDDMTKKFVRYRSIRVKQLTPENTLTETERRDGWRLLFDGQTLNGWMTSSELPSKTPVEDACINPHKCGGYMMIHTQQWANFELKLDFKMSPGCNSGVFIRTSPLKPRPGKDVGFNGMEVQVIDTKTAGYTDTGAIYDLSQPTKNAMKPIGEWNHMEITCNGGLIDVVLNGEKVNHVDLDQFTEANKRPDGSTHKFDVVYKNHPRSGYIGLQDHGSPCWYKNIKLRPLAP